MELYRAFEQRCQTSGKEAAPLPPLPKGRGLRGATIVKIEMAEKVQSHFRLPILLVVDDSQAVVDALVARGFACLHFRWPGEDASRATTRRHNEKLAGEAAT